MFKKSKNLQNSKHGCRIDVAQDGEKWKGKKATIHKLTTFKIHFLGCKSNNYLGSQENIFICFFNSTNLSHFNTYDNK